MQRFISIDSEHPLHSLLLQHHVNKQENGAESANLHPPITSPPQPGIAQPGVFTFSGEPHPITSPMFNSPATPVAKQRGRITGTFANLFARKGSQ